MRCGAFVVMTGLCVSCSADFTPTPNPNPCPCRRLPWLAVACALKVWVVFVFGACCLQDLDRDAHFGRRIRSAGLAGQVTSTARELRAQTREASVRKGILLYCRSAFWRRTSAVPCEIAKDWHVSRSPIRPYVCVCVCVCCRCVYYRVVLVGLHRSVGALWGWCGVCPFCCCATVSCSRGPLPLWASWCCSTAATSSLETTRTTRYVTRHGNMVERWVEGAGAVAATVGLRWVKDAKVIMFCR